MTQIIVIITVIISVIALSNNVILQKLIFNPYLVSKKNQWYRLITSGFIHADWFHLFINMYVLWSFGQAVEMYYDSVFEEKSSAYFIVLYTGALVFSIGPTYSKHKDNYLYNALGASGAVAAIIFASVLFNPWSKIYLFGIIGIPGIVAAILYLVFEYQQGKKVNDNINHDAHFWGAVFGFVFTGLLKPSLFLDFITNLGHVKF